MFVWPHGHEALKRKAWMGRKGQWCAHTEVLMWGLSGICSLFIRRKKTSFSVLHNIRISHLLLVNLFAPGGKSDSLPRPIFELSMTLLTLTKLVADLYVQEMKSPIWRFDAPPLSTGQQSKCAAKLAWAWPNDLNSRTLPLSHWTNIKNPVWALPDYPSTFDVTITLSTTNERRKLLFGLGKFDCFSQNPIEKNYRKKFKYVKPRLGVSTLT